MVEAIIKWQTSPSAFDHLEQPNGDNVLCPWILGLVELCRMIKDFVAGKDFAAGLGIDAIIDGNDQSLICQGLRNHFPQSGP